MKDTDEFKALRNSLGGTRNISIFCFAIASMILLISVLADTWSLAPGGLVASSPFVILGIIAAIWNHRLRNGKASPYYW